MADTGDRSSEQPEGRCVGDDRGAQIAAELVPYVRRVVVHGVSAGTSCASISVVQRITGRRGAAVPARCRPGWAASLLVVSAVSEPKVRVGDRGGVER
jgi:hypothetical protein